MSQNLYDLLEHRQELANTISHGIGLLLVLVAAPVLLAMGVRDSNSYQIVGLGIFCFSMLAVYTSSTIYHAVHEPTTKAVFRQIDHISIYLLIAGTNTPLVLYFLDNTMGYLYLAVMWTMVLIGTIYKIFFMGRLPLTSLIVYIVMGWMGALLLYLTWQDLSSFTTFWLIFGGVSYSIGVFFFVWEKLPYNHTYWHGFVIGGTVGHYIALLGVV